MKIKYKEITGNNCSPVRWQPPSLGRTRSNSANLPFFPASRYVTPPLIVLGMHRSGTSCLAGMLQGVGFSSGAMDGWAPDNQRGNREALEAVKLNDALLNANKAAWDCLPRQGLPIVHEEHRLARDRLLEKAASTDKPWMFKDPRTLLTLSFWREAMPGSRRIGIFRHPWRVAMSLYFRGGSVQKSIRDGLALWIGYNKALMAEHERAPFPVVCFDLAREEFVAQVAAALQHECADLIGKGGLDLDRLGEFYAVELVHQRDMPGGEGGGLDEEELGLLREAEAIYQFLCALSGVKVPEFDSNAVNFTAPLFRLHAADEVARAGDVDRALELYRAVLGATVNDPAAIWRRMIQLQQTREPSAAAVQLCQEALRDCPTDAGLWMQLADIYHKDGQLTEALQAIDSAIRLIPGWGGGYLRKGIILNDMKRWEDAAGAFSAGLAASPTSAWHFVPYGVALMRAGKPTEASVNFRIALERNSAEARAAIHHQWAQALAAVGESDEALEQHALSLANGADKPYMFIGYARALRGKGRLEEAEDVLCVALERGVDTPNVCNLLAQIRGDRGKR